MDHAKCNAKHIVYCARCTGCVTDVASERKCNTKGRADCILPCLAHKASGSLSMTAELQNAYKTLGAELQWAGTLYWLTHNEHHSKFKTLGQMKSHDIDNIWGPFLLFFSRRLLWLAPQGYLLQKVLHSCQPIFRLLNTPPQYLPVLRAYQKQHQTILLCTSQHDCGHSGHSKILGPWHSLCFSLQCRGSTTQRCSTWAGLSVSK